MVLSFVTSCVPRERPDEKKRVEPVRPAPAPVGAVERDGKLALPGTPVTPATSEPAIAPPADEVPPSVLADPALDAPFVDDFSASALGSHWRATSPVWKTVDGRLCGENARNHPIWLARRLPKNAVIEFQASSESGDGDIKAEFWGDGRSAASGQSYTDATSYLTIFGGWKNTFHVLARIDEHATDRKEIKLVPGGADFIRSTVVPRQAYQFRVERRDGHTVRWLVNEMEILSYRDDEPLAGAGHEHFGFNDWQVAVCFDNLRVTPLQD